MADIFDSMCDGVLPPDGSCAIEACWRHGSTSPNKALRLHPLLPCTTTRRTVPHTPPHRTAGDGVSSAEGRDTGREIRARRRRAERGTADGLHGRLQVGFVSLRRGGMDGCLNCTHLHDTIVSSFACYAAERRPKSLLLYGTNGKEFDVKTAERPFVCGCCCSCCSGGVAWRGDASEFVAR